MDDVIAALVLRGVAVHRLVSGDAGCPSSELHNNAVHMEVSLEAGSAKHDIYLVRWRRATDYQSGKTPFEDCIAEYRSLRPDVRVDALEAEPWRAYGPEWTDPLRQTIEDALRASARA